jgi:hypothetical protein
MKNIRPYLLASFFFLAAHLAVAQPTVTIYDIQYVDPAGGTGDSPYNGQTVMTTGVVTASAEPYNLDAVFIQQEGLTEWAGIQLKSGPGLETLVVGDIVNVTGDVQEISGFTVINYVTDFEVIGTSTISPVILAPEIFTNYSLAETEKYEGMLIELKIPDSNIAVVNSNPDAPNNYGEWRVGSDLMNEDDGCRILTGRQTSTVFSSLNVSYVNDEIWATNSGTMNVPPIVVENGNGFADIQGIMFYGFGDMKLLPRNNDDCSNFTLGISQLESDQFKLYPNPAQDYINLYFNLAYSNLSVKLFDLTGRTVYDKSFERIESIQLELGMPSGIYLLSIETETGLSVTRKLIKE